MNTAVLTGRRKTAIDMDYLSLIKELISLNESNQDQRITGQLVLIQDVLSSKGGVLLGTEEEEEDLDSSTLQKPLQVEEFEAFEEGDVGDMPIEGTDQSHFQQEEFLQA